MGMASRLLNSLLSERAGATAIEYGLIAALISVSLIAGFTSVTDALNNIFTAINDSLRPTG